METVLELRGVARAFPGGIVALRQVSLTVGAGEFVAVMGATGSGKSTLLHCAAGLDRPTAGSVRLAGREISRLRERALTRWRRDRVGFVFQSYNLLSELTVRQNLALPGRLGGPRRRGLDEVLDAVGLAGTGARPVGELSGGQRQRVAIARALVTGPSVIFADEPTRALDPTTGGQILGLPPGRRRGRGDRADGHPRPGRGGLERPAGAAARGHGGHGRGHARRADPPPLPARTLWRRIRALPGDPTAWRALAYCFARWPLMVAGAYPGLFAVVAAPVAVTYPLWWLVRPEYLWDTDTWGGTWWIAVQGLAVLVVTPWWMRLIVLIDGFLVRGLLHPSRSQQRIAELEAGRAALQSDAAAMLRRVERDLHDGTQARLVALGLTLSRIENHSTEPPVRALAADARGTVTEALAELRDIVRGMHPPALDDGLEVALTTLASRSAVPAEVSVSLPDRPPDATASALYFAVAELLTNIARHAGASRVRIGLSAEHHRLRLTVTDDGHGGAVIRPAGSAGPSGTGLTGLARRAAALDGSLSVDSPAGGPTTVTMILPAASR